MAKTLLSPSCALLSIHFRFFFATQLPNSSRALTKLSKHPKPTLCRLLWYSTPGLPRPTISIVLFNPTLTKLVGLLTCGLRCSHDISRPPLRFSLVIRRVYGQRAFRSARVVLEYHRNQKLP